MSQIEVVSDLSSAFSAGLRGIDRPEIRDPWNYFGEKAPKWAKCAWEGKPYFNEGTRILVPGEITLQDYGHEMGGVGGKGAGKTFLFSMRDLILVQKYPGSKGMVVANSYAQAYGSAGTKIVEISNAIGLEFFHRTEMVVDGIKHYNVYVFPQFDSYICILSFDNINLIEGTEWDWAHFEEIQDCPLEGVETAVSRVRRGLADSSVVYAGMPDDVNHWMYAYFDDNKIPLYEPPLKENEHNLPPTYMKRMRRYHGADFDRYVEGKRISLFRTPALRNFRWDIHVASDDNPEVAALGYLCNYDPASKLYISWDFNVNPLCVSVWQWKVAPFSELGKSVRKCPECGQELVYSTLFDGYGCIDHGMVLNPVQTNAGRVNKEILVQIDEFEMFGGNTSLMCDEILKTYGRHHNGGLVLGDSTGSKEQTSTQVPGETDWKIIKARLGKLRNMIIRPGVVRHRKSPTAKRKHGEPRITYTNPPIRDRVSILNAFLIDEDGHPRLIFMPESKYPSGGAAKSCGEAKWTGDGKIDSKNDKREPTERAVARTHFFDNTGYLIYYLCDGKMPGIEVKPTSHYTDRAKLATRMRYTGV